MLSHLMCTLLKLNISSICNNPLTQWQVLQHFACHPLSGDIVEAIGFLEICSHPKEELQQQHMLQQVGVEFFLL